MASIGSVLSFPLRDDSGQQNTDSGLSAAIITIVALFIILVVLTLALRMYTRIIVLKDFGWEEWTMCLAALGQVGLCTSGVTTLRFGLMLPTEQMSFDDMSAIAKLINAIRFLYTPVIALTKLSILLQMTRIFIPIPGTKSFYAMQVFIWFNMLWFTSDYCIDISRCFPHSRTLSQPIRVDFTMLLMPMFWITRLQLSISRKITACAVFTVGVIACAASTLRLIYAVKFWRNNAENSMDSTIEVAICMAAEATAGIICGNLPSLPAFIKHFRAKYHDSKSGSRTEPPSDHEMTVARNNEQYLSSPDQMPDLIFVQETPVVEGSQDEV